jgi:hypothetical protein
MSGASWPAKMADECAMFQRARPSSRRARRRSGLEDWRTPRPAPCTPARLSPSSCIFMNLQMAGYGCASGAAGCTQAYYRRLVVPAPHEPIAGQANETEKNI